MNKKTSRRDIRITPFPRTRPDFAICRTPAWECDWAMRASMQERCPIWPEQLFGQANSTASNSVVVGRIPRATAKVREGNFGVSPCISRVGRSPILPRFAVDAVSRTGKIAGRRDECHDGLLFPPEQRDVKQPPCQVRGVPKKSIGHPACPESLASPLCESVPEKYV